ncbi:MAG: hypothetical protein V1725_06470 [archaeon]
MTLKQLVTDGIATIAALPANNAITMHDLNKYIGYTVPLIAHDYAAKTPQLWNALYARLNLPYRNIMLVANPENIPIIFAAFRKDPKYLGGGAGVGFKEKVIPYLDKVVPEDLKSVNIIVKEQGLLVGYNTDAKGLYLSVEQELMKLNKSVNGSAVVLIGAGGVAKEFAKHLAEHGARRIAIINRTVWKATTLAHDLSTTFGIESYAVPEDSIRGAVLNTIVKPDIIVNTSDKGSDALPETAAFAAEGPTNNTQSLELLRNLYLFNPDVVLIDIVLPQRRSITLRLAESAKLEHLVDGTPMVINQAAPAFKLVADAHPGHGGGLSEAEILEYMT